MNDNMKNKLREARDIFSLDEYPGNFFEQINHEKFFYEQNFFLFKEPLGSKESGFIHYKETGLCIICINYSRSLGHQNFTLAHEIGHWLLHTGRNFDDTYNNLSNYKDSIEKEANEFASELLYPNYLLDLDHKEALENNYFNSNKRKELAVFIDEICHRYVISFEFALRKLLYKNNQGSNNQLKKVRKEIEKALGGKISKYFERDFYCVNYENDWYQRNKLPYDIINKLNEKRLSENKISFPTSESLHLKYNVGGDR